MKDIINVVWTPVIFNGKEYHYKISEFGTIMNTETNHILTPVPLKNGGYLRVLLYEHGIRKDAKVHRLVYESFNGPIPKNMTVDHIDENKYNNHYTNLRLLTPSENIKSYLKNHPDHAKKYSDGTIIEYLKLLKKGMYYRDAADKCNIHSYDYAQSLKNGRRRVELVNLYSPFPSSVNRKSVFNESDEKAAIGMIMSGIGSKEILDRLEITYSDRALNKIYKLRRNVGIKDPKFFSEEFINDIDTLILNNKSNQEIYDILHIELNKNISWLMSRRRILLKIPNNNFTKGNKEELELIRKLILEGFSNNEILDKINKGRNQYYINLFGKERRKLKQKSDDILTSSTIP